MRGRDGRLCLGDVQRLRLFVHPSGPRCCFVILMAVYDAGAVSVCESFSIENSLCLLRCEVLQVLLIPVFLWVWRRCLSSFACLL